ncbi:NDR1/HIN1-like protein 6 [Glycine soja]
MIDNEKLMSTMPLKESKVYSDVVIVVKADNQNEDIGLDYLDNEVGIMYLGSQLSSGQIPPFLQPGKNTTKVNVELKGENEFGVEMQKSVYRGLGERENSFVDNSEASHKACD